MKKYNMTGWKDVLLFTLKQSLKNKAFIITYIILLTVSLVTMPIIQLITSNNSENKKEGPFPIQKVYVINETKLSNIDFKELLQDEAMQHITFEALQEDYAIVSDRIEKTENSSAILTLLEDEDVYNFSFTKASKGPIKDRHMQALANVLTESFEVFKLKALEVTKEQTALIQAKVGTKVTTADANGNATPITKKDTSITVNEYWLVYAIIIFIFFVNIFASTQIATSIVTEKSTRVIEYLLTSVKPLALVMGKIVAMLTAVLIQIISMIVMLFVSSKITSLLSGDGNHMISQFFPKNLLETLSLVNIGFCLIMIIMGLVFYSVLAGLAGATVSRLEEINEGLMLFTITSLIGFYIALGAVVSLLESGTSTFVTFSLLFPLSSTFLLPGALLVGKVSTLLAIGAILLQLTFILILFRFVAKVYEALILHNGNKIKLNQLFKLSKTV